MDAFNVPKKVNRHVLKALNFLSQGKYGGAITTSKILAQVKYQMRNLVPVPNIDMVIQKSLKNLSDIGLIERVGAKKYAMGNSYIPQSSSKPSGQSTVERKYLRPGAARKRSISVLNPNFNRTQQYVSNDSLSGDDYDRTRKRMRSNNKKIKYVGRKTELPKVRQYNPINDFETLPLTSRYQLDSPLDENMGISILYMPDSNINRDYDYSSKSPLPPLLISEDFSEKELSSTIPSATESLTTNKSNNIDYIPSKISLPSSSQKFVNNEKHPSDTSVSLNQVPVEKSPSCTSSKPQTSSFLN